MEKSDIKYSINLSFSEITVPPVEDILVLGKQSKHGKTSVFKSFQYLVPDTFEAFDVDHENVEAIFVHKRILQKIKVDKIINIFNKNVFPFVSPEEIIRVDFKLTVLFDKIEL